MNTYAILLLPSHNRVYLSQTATLATAEVELCSHYLDAKFENITIQPYGGVEYVTFRTETDLNFTEIATLSRLSCVYAIFKTDDQYFIPLEKSKFINFDDDINSIQKYSGKTNELFTRLMLNIAMLSAPCVKNVPHHHIQILDPVCGRGTTLFEALTQGYSCTGIELDKKQCEQLVQFFERYLQTKKYKHQIDTSPITDHKGIIGRMHSFVMARTKEEFKNNLALNLKLIQGDTLLSAKYLKKETFQAIVGDLPYGVQHGSRSPSGSFTRNPTELLEQALPGWVSLLQKGGALVLSWNTFVAPKDKLISILEKYGLTCLTDGPYQCFEHRVDQSILRDVIVGIRN